ncbi:hypothetical protein ACFZDK_24840 [Streptomyces sp. NPDC007901]|uniref:hypothetical protein n=1 Tax=Streptomyces sp. NPDC007901 TaxID=3364785 RepID=UPI0036EDCB25
MTTTTDTQMATRVEQDAARIMAAITDPTAAFQALATEYGIQVEEWDARGLDEDLRAQLRAHYLEKDGRRIFVVRVGQDPAERLSALRALLAYQEVAPA